MLSATAGLKNRAVRQRLYRTAAGILAAVVAFFWAATPARAALAVMKRPSPTLIELSGGEGRQAWRLLYGTRAGPADPFTVALIPAGEDRAWFVHFSWLRLIDTQKGIILGRWHFPGQIVRVVPDGSRAQVEVKAQDGPPWDHLHQTISFDPSAPKILFWWCSHLLILRLPSWEADYHAPPSGYISGALGEVSTARAKELIAELEEGVRRDPYSPWLRVTLGKLLADAGDPHAGEVYRQAVEIQSTDFTELLPISAFLLNHGQQQTADMAFERGYKDFERGTDPRALSALIARLVLYPVNWTKLTEEQRRAFMERVYQLAPRAEGADYAWPLYANWLEKHGRAEEARLWRARGEETSRQIYFSLEPLRGVDRVLPIAGASILALLLYFLALAARYRSQVKLALASRLRAGGTMIREPFPGRARRFLSPSVEYWERRERTTFLAIALAGWLAAGVAGVDVQAALRMARFPLSFWMGSFGAPPVVPVVQSRLPASPERDLLLALAYQQAGETDKAEELYRKLPDFPEAWNDLGALLKESGREQEARQAFEQALRLQPQWRKQPSISGVQPAIFGSRNIRSTCPAGRCWPCPGRR